MSELIVGAIIVAFILHMMFKYFKYIQISFYVVTTAAFCWLIGFTFLKLMKGFWG